MRSLTETILFLIPLGLIMSVGIVGNLIVFASVLVVRRLRKTLSNFLIMNLAAADFLASSLLLPFQFAFLIDPELITDDGWFCKVGGTLSYPFYIASTFTLVMLSLDRHIAIHHPLRYQELVTPRVVLLMVLGTWGYAAFFTFLLGYFATVEYDKHSIDCGVSWDESPMWLNWASVVLNVAVPFFFLAIINLRVLLVAREQHRRIRNETLQNTSGRGKEVKTTLSIALVIFVFLICWLPFIASRALRTFGVDISRVVSMVVVWILHASNAVNFFLYALSRSDYRMAFKAVLRCNTDAYRTDVLSTISR